MRRTLRYYTKLGRTQNATILTPRWSGIHTLDFLGEMWSAYGLRALANRDRVSEYRYDQSSSVCNPDHCGVIVVPLHFDMTRARTLVPYRKIKSICSIPSHNHEIVLSIFLRHCISSKFLDNSHEDSSDTNLRGWDCGLARGGPPNYTSNFTIHLK